MLRRDGGCWAQLGSAHLFSDTTSACTGDSHIHNAGIQIKRAQIWTSVDRRCKQAVSYLCTSCFQLEPVQLQLGLEINALTDTQRQHVSYFLVIFLFFFLSFSRDKVSASEICATLNQNVTGPRVNNSHCTAGGQVQVSFNEARKQFVRLNWPQAITLCAILSQQNTSYVCVRACFLLRPMDILLCHMSLFLPLKGFKGRKRALFPQDVSCSERVRDKTKRPLAL